MITCGHCKQQHTTVDEVRACSGNVVGTNWNSPSVSTRDEIPPVVNTGERVGCGYYTIVFNDKEDDRVTLRVRPHWDDDRARRGEQVVDFLRGPDNTSDYAGFAFLGDRGVKMWRRFEDNTRLHRAVGVMLKDPAEAGMAYALRSGNCYRCGRTLTVPASIHRGLGPVCAGKA